MGTHPYKHTHAHPIPMSTSERLRWLDLKIHEVSQQERLAVDVVFHEFYDHLTCSYLCLGGFGLTA
jgi:hypothetical protein